MNTEHDFKNNNYEKLKCIWMASQVIEYKLCDIEFDCENCLFDKGMRNLADKKGSSSGVTSNAVSLISEKLRNVKYDKSIVYLMNNLIVKEICRDTYYLGINPILSSFLDAVNSIDLFDNDKNIFTGQDLIRIFGTWGSVSISSPINFMIHDKVGNPNDDPLKSQWLAIIGGSQQEISSVKLCDAEWNRMHEKAIGIIEEIESHVPKIGATMMDGGNQIKFLYQLVGSKKYINILKSLTI